HLVGRAQVAGGGDRQVERSLHRVDRDVVRPAVPCIADDVEHRQQDEQGRDPVERPAPPARTLLHAQEFVERLWVRMHGGGSGVGHGCILSLTGVKSPVSCHPPPSAWVRLTKALARSASAAALALRAASSSFSDASRLRKSVSPAWYWLRASKAELSAASSASANSSTRSSALSRSIAAVSTSSSAASTDSRQAARDPSAAACALSIRARVRPPSKISWPTVPNRLPVITSNRLP